MKTFFMKTASGCTTILASFLLLTIGITACQKDETNQKLRGSADLDQNKVGYKTSAGIYIGSKMQRSDLEVVDNQGGIITINISGVLDDATYQKVEMWGEVLLGEEFTKRRSEIMGPGGQVNATLKFKNTTEGVSYVQDNGKESILMKYNVKEGDRWSFTQSGTGKKVNCKVVHKSTEDDYQMGFINIKVVKVESTAQGTPGISKVVYIGNHKFGLVAIEIYQEDGTIVDIWI